MTRAELAAGVAAVLDQPRTDPDRLTTIMALVDKWTRRGATR